jgi:hypothetical protein
LARFPEYRHVDGVYYLIGYCLNEMGELEEAIAAWRVLVCANHFVYTGPIAPPPVSEELTAEEAEAARIAEHPSLGLTAAEAPEPVPTEFVDPYVGCVPVREGADFAMETWLRLGEYHFDFDPEPFFLERSISAYNYVLQDPHRPALQPRALQGRMGVLPRESLPRGPRVLRAPRGVVG